jgi:hypothetical protein
LAIFRANAGGFSSRARRTGFGPFEQHCPGFTLSRHPKGQTTGYSAAWPIRGFHVRASCQRSGLRRSALRLIRPLLTPAPRSSILTDRSVSKPETRRRSPEVRPTAFTARPPDLPPQPLMAVDFAILCSLVRPGRPRYPVLVHRAAALLHASFRPRLATTPLRFANPSPPSGWIEDLHLQAVDHARHTQKDRLAAVSPKSDQVF